MSSLMQPLARLKLTLLLLCFSHAAWTFEASPSHDIQTRKVLEKMAQDHLVPTHQLLPWSKRYEQMILNDAFIESDDAQKALENLTHYTYKTERFSFRLFPKMGYVFSNSEPLRFIRTNAATNPLLGSNQGLFVNTGHWGFVGTGFEASFFDTFHIVANPYWRLSEVSNRANEGHSNFFLNETYASIELNNLSIQGGKIGTSWGAGKVHKLLFSGENEPIWMFRLLNQNPITLPWFLRHLGSVRAEAFYGLLDDAHLFPGGYLIGTYFSFLPHPRFEFGLGQVVQFGGDGAPSNNPLIFFSERVADRTNPGNRNFLLSARWRIPTLEVEPYVDIMIEDCCAEFYRILNPRDTVLLAGLFFPHIGAGKKIDLAIEWIRTNQISYRHPTYTSGMIYRNRLIGAALGPDGNGIYARVRYFQNPELQWRLTFSHELRGRLEVNNLAADPGFQESDERHRFDIETLYEFKPKWILTPHLGIEHVNNQDYIRNNPHYQFAAGLSIERVL